MMVYTNANLQKSAKIILYILYRSTINTGMVIPTGFQPGRTSQSRFQSRFYSRFNAASGLIPFFVDYPGFFPRDGMPPLIRVITMIQYELTWYLHSGQSRNFRKRTWSAGFSPIYNIGWNYLFPTIYNHVLIFDTPWTSVLILLNRSNFHLRLMFLFDTGDRA